MFRRFHITRDVAVVYAAQLIQVLISFVSSILLARWLGKVGQGEITLYNNALSFLVLITSFGIPSALVYFISAKKIRKQQYLSLLRLTLGLALLGSAFLIGLYHFFFTEFFPAFFEQKLAWMALLLLHVIIVIKQQLGAALLQSEKRFNQQALYAIVGGALYLLTIALLFRFEHTPSLTWVLLAMLGNLIIQLILFYGYIFRNQKEYLAGERLSLGVLQAIFSFGFLALLTNLIQFLNYKMDVWFLNYYFHDTGMIGIYAIAVTLVQMIWLFPQAIQSVIYQGIAAEPQERLRWNMALAQLKLIAWYALLAALPAYLLGTYLIPLFYGAPFQESVPIFQSLLWAILPFCLTMPLSAYFAGTGRVQVNLYSAILGFVICLVANMYFIPKYAAMGAVYSSIASYVATTLFLLIVFFIQKRK